MAGIDREHGQKTALSGAAYVKGMHDGNFPLLCSNGLVIGTRQEGTEHDLRIQVIHYQHFWRNIPLSVRRRMSRVSVAHGNATTGDEGARQGARVEGHFDGVVAGGAVEGTRTECVQKVPQAKPETARSSGAPSGASSTIPALRSCSRAMSPSRVVQLARYRPEASSGAGSRRRRRPAACPRGRRPSRRG